MVRGADAPRYPRGHIARPLGQAQNERRRIKCRNVGADLQVRPLAPD